jgi:hypothetical protein
MSHKREAGPEEHSPEKLFHDLTAVAAPSFFSHQEALKEGDRTFVVR